MSEYKVLIAGDKQLLALIIDNILNDLNLENTIVHSRKDTLLAYHNDYYNTVLLDKMMRVLLGLEVSNELCKTNSHIPISALTSVPFRDNKKDSGLSGINHYISKPTTAKELQDLLKEYFKTAA